MPLKQKTCLQRPRPKNAIPAIPAVPAVPAVPAIQSRNPSRNQACTSTRVLHAPQRRTQYLHARYLAGISTRLCFQHRRYWTPSSSFPLTPPPSQPSPTRTKYIVAHSAIPSTSTPFILPAPRGSFSSLHTCYPVCMMRLRACKPGEHVSRAAVPTPP
jgi:hypothetical protein